LQILHGAWNIYDAVKGGGSIEKLLVERNCISLYGMVCTVRYNIKSKVCDDETKRRRRVAEER